MKVLIGRAPDCDVVLRDPSVSARHAALTISGGAYLLEDLGSTNGTRVNATPITRTDVTTRDVLLLGDAALTWPQLLLQLHRKGAGGLALDCMGVGVTLPGRRFRQVLSDITFRATCGQLVGVIGPSGAGKSTLLKAIAGQLPPTSGAIMYNGVTVNHTPEQAWGWVGYVPQDDIIHRELVLREALGFAAELRVPHERGLPNAEGRVLSAAGVCSLTPHLAKRIHSLSGGERKRASVATELLTHPPVLVLDEPTSGLDPALEREMMMLFRSLADQGHLVLVSTHATRSLELCDRVAVLAGGQAAYFGSYPAMIEHFGVSEPADLYQKLSDPLKCWARFMQSSSFRRYVGRPIAAAPPEALPSPRQAGGFWTQMGILLRRNLAVIRGDARNVAFLAGQAPAIAIVVASVFPGDTFTATGSLQHAPALIFVLTMAALWFGTSNAAREVVKERAIYLRERMLGLRTPAYVLSKALPLAAIGLLQALVLVLLVGLRTDWFGQAGAGAVIGLWLLLGLVAACGVAGGLLISTFAGSSDQAVSLTPIVLLPQLIFSGIFPAVEEGGALMRGVSRLAASNWGYAAAGRILDINAVLGQSPLTAQLRRDAFDRDLGASLWVLVAMLLVLVALSCGAMSCRKR